MRRFHNWLVRASSAVLTRSWRHAFGEIFTTDFTDFTDGRRYVLSEGICKGLMGRGFRSTIKGKAGEMAEEFLAGEPLSAKCRVRNA